MCLACGSTLSCNNLKWWVGLYPASSGLITFLCGGVGMNPKLGLRVPCGFVDSRLSGGVVSGNVEETSV